jgi:hypothetical protein
MLTYPSTPQSAACNDNGAFAALRVRTAAPRDILGAAVRTTGPISLTQLSDGVLIIRECARGPAESRRRSAQ